MRLLGLLLLIACFMPHETRANCFLVGDSIAVGLKPYINCPASAKVGIPSAAVAKRATWAKTLVISAGSNDPGNPNLGRNLREIRAKGKRAIWVIPQHKRAAAVVRRVAADHGDPVVTFLHARDGVHPRSYKELSKAVNKELHK